MQTDSTHPPRFFTHDGYVFQTLKACDPVTGEHDGDYGYLRKGTVEKFGITDDDDELAIARKVGDMLKQARKQIVGLQRAIEQV